MSSRELAFPSSVETASSGSFANWLTKFRMAGCLMGLEVADVFARGSSRSALNLSSRSWTTLFTTYFLSSGLGFVASRSASTSCRMGLAMMRMSLNRNRKRSLTVFAFATWRTGEDKMSFRGGSSIAEGQSELFEPRPSTSSSRSMMIAPAVESLGAGSGEWCEDDIVDENDSDVERVGKSSSDDCGSGVVDEGGSGGDGNPGEE